VKQQLTPQVLVIVGIAIFLWGQAFDAAQWRMFLTGVAFAGVLTSALAAFRHRAS
jgi:hypothetical protein